ncbi:MAG: hypothetical protein MK201_05870 [Gammaproteobacteria bacterium]|nr:hypothetical protein [Gammaproteobacteria bacterium]
MNKAIDAAAVVANEKCDLFTQIDLQLRGSKILSNSDVNISFEENPIIKKPEAALAKAFDHLVSIRAQVRTNPISGEVINDQPIIVSAWKNDSFNLQEGCETPSDQEVITKAFSSVKEAVNYFLKNLNAALSMSDN